jgi:adenylate cyclase
MDRPDEIDVTFLISDLAGYTALTEAHGNLHAAQVIHRYVQLADSILTPSVRRVERVGDELLIVADSPADAVGAAIRLRELIDQEPRFPTVRCGIHRGSIVVQGGAYFGAALNLTARVASHARAGQVLCSDRVAHAAPELPDVTYRPLGPVRFKNVPEPIQIFEVVWGRPAAGEILVDPVCQMRVAPESETPRLPFGSEVHYFCSFECARQFAARPEDYVKR